MRRSSLALSALLATSLWASSVVAQSSGPPEQLTPSYKITLAIGRVEPLLMPDQAATAKEGEVMAQMPGMPMPSMAMTDQGQPVNHHLEVHVYSRASGAVVKDVMPTISITNQDGAIRTLDMVMAMYDMKAGESDWHYGNNVYLPDGSYSVRPPLTAKPPPSRTWR